jgi:hypothetical protein
MGHSSSSPLRTVFVTTNFPVNTGRKEKEVTEMKSSRGISWIRLGAAISVVVTVTVSTTPEATVPTPVHRVAIRPMPMWWSG